MRFIFLLLIFVSVGKVFSQSNLSGVIFNKSNTVVQFASISVKGVANHLEKTIQTDSAGAFSFDNLDSGQYSITITHAGYSPYESTFYLQSDTVLTVLLQSTSVQLSEVLVSGSRSVMERSSGKVVYNVENSVTAAGSDVLQAISQIPGVRVGNNEINLVGRGVAKVMMNDRLLQLQGEDLMRYLKSFSTAEIVRIEVISNPSSKYEAEGNAGLINIITRHSKRKGYSGTVQLASKYYLYGVSSMYGVSTFGEFGGSGNLAYNSNKWSLYAGINHVRDRHLEGFGTDVFYPNQSWMQTDTGLYTHSAVTGIAGVDYKLSPNAIIGASYSGGRDVYAGSDNVRNPIYNKAGKLDSLLRTYATYNPVALLNSINVHADIRLDTTGKQIFFNADYFNYYRTDRSDFESNSYDAQGKYKPEGKTRYFDDNKQNIIVSTLKADADMPASFAKFSLGAKVSFISNYSNAFYYSKTNAGSLVYNTNLSNEFDYTENTQAVYGNISKNINKWKLQAGLRGENTQTRGYSYTNRQATQNNYFKIFPSLLISYSVNANSTYSLSVNRRINRPSFWNLNPFKSLYTAFSYGEGNPYLQPEYNSNIELVNTFKNILITSLFANKTGNGFNYVTIAYPDTNLVYTKPLNFIQTVRIGISENVSFKPVSIWESNALVSFYHTKARSAISSIGDIGGFGAYLSSTNNLYFNQSKTFAAAISFWYQFPEVDHIARSDRYYKLDIGVKATTRNKKWDIALNLNDAFRSSALAYSYTVNSIPQKFTNFQIIRYLQLSLNYRFGSGTTKNRSTGNEEERGRVH